jgi:aminoglycoside phosphotransferase family enzyme/predicted kinase
MKPMTGHSVEGTISSEALVRELQQAAAYPDHPVEVQLIETHISWVFLTERHAYKLKKPVKFDFLDFSTREARRRDCEDEIRLNRRMAPNVYQAVVPVTMDHRQRIQVEGAGQIVDWAVKMRRLPTEQSLEQLIRRDQLSEEQVDALAQTLAEYYQGASPLVMRADEYVKHFEDHIRANRRDLLVSEHGLDSAQVKRVHTAQLLFLRCDPQSLRNRVCDGRVIEGHGDLRPEHIVFDPGPLVFDCVEFNAELRQVDVLDELGFLAMECDSLGAEQVGERVVGAYCDKSGDRPSEALRNFYKAYRACVRAKVAVLRGDQLNAASRGKAQALARRYLQLATRYCRGLGPPVLLVVRGLMGTGKTTLANALAETLGADHLQTDQVRREMDDSASAYSEGYGQGRYSPQQRDRVYDALLEQARLRLEEGISVVLDGTFLTDAHRQKALGLARGGDIVPLVVTCRCPDHVARQRIEERLASGRSLSEARPELLAQQRSEEEPADDGRGVLEVDTTNGLDGQILQVTERLARRWRGATADGAPCSKGR